MVNFYNKCPVLFEHKSNFNLFKNLLEKGKFPKVISLSGMKGIGKFTLIYHVLISYLDKSNYDLNDNKINDFSNLSKYTGNLIYLGTKNNKHLSIDDIRDLKKDLQKTVINDLPRFILIDDVELLNISCINSLLKLIEEPSKINNFILIDNSNGKMHETLKSRCLGFKIYLNNSDRLKIIRSLVEYYNINSRIDVDTFNISPGRFINFNDILDKNDLDLGQNLVDVLKKLFQLYKKNKDKSFIDLSIYVVERHMSQTIINENNDLEKIQFIKMKTIKDINNLVKYNLNNELVLNSISSRMTQ
tara:strand:+ start:1743 stop:2648 length:906 start_codon:yes stop_codon:yes gene_type:complete